MELIKTNKKRKAVCIGIIVIMLSCFSFTIILICFADVTKHLRCSIVDSIGMHLNQCGITGQLETLEKYDVSEAHTKKTNGTETIFGYTNSSSNIIVEAKFNISDDYEHSDNITQQDRNYLVLAERSWDTAWEIFHDARGWQLEKGDSLETGRVYSKTYENFGTVQKLKGYLDASPEELFQLLVIEGKLSSWSPMIADSIDFHRVNKQIKISYTTTATIAGGWITPRDYVNLSYWKSRGNVTLHCITAATHPDYPENDHYIRGINRPGGVILKPVKGNPKRCLFEWSVSSDIGGWLSDWMIESGKTDSMLEFFIHIRDKIIALHPNK